MKQRWTLIVLTLALVACGGERATPTGNEATTPANANTTTTAVTAEVDDRDSWQKPEEIFRIMGDLNGKKIADLFAGDGYFTFRLIDQGANVIAIENDPNAVAALEARKKELGLSDERLTIRLVPAGDPGIGMSEADIAMCVNHYANVPDRVRFFNRLRDGLKVPHQLYVIDFKPVDTPVGPPLETRLDVETIMNELGDARYDDVAAHSGLLPYQFIMVGQDVYEMPPAQ